MINIDALNDDEKLAALESIHKSIAESKEIQKKKITTNVELIVKALKKIESDLKQRYDETGQLIANLKNGEDGRDGKDGKDGKNGRDGRDGPVGPRGYDGLPGRNGIDGTDGVSVTDAHIDFDGSLIISLSSGRVINVGEVVAADIAEKIKVITNGGGTSQGVLDAIASLQAQIDSIASGLEYQGTWNASTNVPTLASSVGTAGYYYIVATAGSTNLNGVTDWQIGDWAVFNGSVWQKIDQTNLVTSVAGRTGAVVLSNTDISGLGTMSTQAANNVSITGGSITGITDLAIADGGTGASTAANARTNLGLVIGTDVLSPTGSAASLTSFPTFNQNTTGTAANVTGTVAIANGGTGATTAGAARTALGATTVGANVFTLTNPSAITFPRFNADNTVSALDAATFRTAIGAGTSSTTGTVTSVAASVPTFLSIGGSPITSSGTLAITLSGTALPTTSGGTGLTSFTSGGVVYASSTSALATGSALTFDGTLLNNTGFVPKFRATVTGGASSTELAIDGIYAAGTDLYLLAPTGRFMSFYANNSEQMRLTSTGLGIGTSSPATKLDVNGQSRFGGVLQITGAGVPASGGGMELGGSASDSSITSFNRSLGTYLIQYFNALDYSFATSGTERMRLTSTGLGIGTSSPAGKLDVFTAATSIAYVRTANQTMKLTADDAGSRVDLANAAGSPISFTIGTTEQMRLTSTGLGIGTSSPYLPLSVSKVSDTTFTNLPANILSYDTTAMAAGVGGGIWFGGKYNSSTNDQTVFAGISGIKENGTTTNVAGTLVFGVRDGSGGTTIERMRLDSSGNLGLGVTPSAWNTSYKALEIGALGNSLIGFGASDVAISSGAYYSSSGWKYSATNSLGASFYEQYTGGHLWYVKTAVSHSAGDAITFTQAMTLDASGNLGLGATTTAGGRLVISQNNATQPAIYLPTDESTIQGPNSDSQIRIGNNLVLQSGNVTGVLAKNASGYIYFSTGATPTERARIDSSGNLLLGTTSVISAGKYSSSFAGATENGIILQTTLASTGSAFIGFVNSSGSTIGTVTQNGASTVAYNTSSDYRLKNTIAPMTGALSKVALLKPCTYKWNSDGSNGQGFIAHELAEVVPECVSGEKDAVDENGNPKYQGIDTSFLVATLTAAIQEQQAIINQLKARLDAANL